MKKSDEAGETQDSIQKLLDETTTFKKIIQEKLESDPDNLADHRMYCTYVRRILEIHKSMIQAQSVDQESLLIAALKCVVLTLIEKGETQAAEVVGHYLEEIGEKVREKWLDCKEPGKASMTSEDSSNGRSPRLRKNRRGKRKNGSNKP